jgi:putative transposase
MRAYRHQGLSGLARKPYPDRGHPTLSGPLQQLIEGLALRRPRLSCAAVHREVVALANERGWQPPSYDIVYSVIRRLDPALVTLAHHGAKVYADRYDLIYRREASRSNEMWQADHTPLDMRVLDERGRPARPWLTSSWTITAEAVAGCAQPARSSSIQTARVAASYLAQG